MKTLTVFLLGSFMVFSALAQEGLALKVVKPDGPDMTFTEEKFDFGDIFQGDVVEHTFKFENTGTEPLVISNVSVTCGCTATDWPRKPISVGDEASITVEFNSRGKMGRQNKVISIYSNGILPLYKVSIVTNVLPKKEGSN